MWPSAWVPEIAASVEALDELRRADRLLDDLDRRPGGGDLDLGERGGDRALRLGGAGLDRDERVLGAHDAVEEDRGLGAEAGDERVPVRRAVAGVQRELRGAVGERLAIDGEARAVGSPVAHLDEHAPGVAPELALVAAVFA